MSNDIHGFYYVYEHVDAMSTTINTKQSSNTIFTQVQDVININNNNNTIRIIIIIIIALQKNQKIL